MTELSSTSLKLVTLVGQFGQLSSLHLHHLVFPDAASRTSCDRALMRLVRDGFLMRVQHRMVGGNKGGSGQYVYQLGRRGHFMLRPEENYNPRRAIDYHSIAIADAYLALKQMDKAALISLDAVSTEPDCWVVIGSYELKPDLYVEITRAGRTSKLWLEIDMGTESQRVIRDKLLRYWSAYNAADASDWPEFPMVLWVAIDDERARELMWVIKQGQPDQQALFRVTTLEKLTGYLTP